MNGQSLYERQRSSAENWLKRHEIGVRQNLHVLETIQPEEQMTLFCTKALNMALPCQKEGWRWS